MSIRARLEKNMNLDELKFDENGTCHLVIGDAYQVDVLRDERLARYVLTSPVAAELPEETTYELMQDLLSFALGPVFDGSPAVGRDPSSGLLIAYSVLPFALATESDFPEQFARFLEFRTALADRFAAVERGETGMEDSEENLLSSGNLISV